MECQKKNRSSYQTLKEDFELIKAERIQEKTKNQILENALWKIVQLKGAELVNAPEIALGALVRTSPNETK